MDIKDLVSMKRIDLAGIPCLYFQPGFDAGINQTVVFYHGWHSRKENNLFIGKVLALHGYRVILPDAFGHGERGSLEYDNYEVLVENFWNIILLTVEESKALLKAAEENLGIDCRRIAVMGSSMGGFIAGGVYAHNKDIKCLININGSCAWENVESLFRQEDGRGLSDEMQFARIKENDPLGLKAFMYPRPILLMHGDADSQIPVDTQRYFYNSIKDAYEDEPQRLKYVEVPGLNHQKTIGMLEEACGWLDKWMQI